MNKIANIVTTSNYSNDLYNVTSDMEQIDNNVPTLVISWVLAKKMYKDADILDWKYSDNQYWTFGKREKRDVYEKNITEFDKLVISKLINRIDYKFINLLTCNNDVKVKLFNKLNDSNKKCILIDSDIVYIYYQDCKSVVGFSLNDIDYSGKDRRNIINILKSNCNIKIITIDECYNLSISKDLEKRHTYLYPYLLF